MSSQVSLIASSISLSDIKSSAGTKLVKMDFNLSTYSTEGLIYVVALMGELENSYILRVM